VHEWLLTKILHEWWVMMNDVPLMIESC
jgi:hypothetical protein